jgi:hypothetical protein
MVSLQLMRTTNTEHLAINHQIIYTNGKWILCGHSHSCGLSDLNQQIR